MFLTWLLLIGNVILLLALCGILTRFACLVVTVKGKSMYPTLKDSDRVVVLSWWPKSRLRKGQIILFASLYTVPLEPTDKHAELGQLHIKRIVAVAGERVITSLSDVHESSQAQVARYHDERGRRVWDIPPDHVFVQGDNHQESVDSLVAGPLPLQSVRGLVLTKLPGAFLL